jgi:hypothetical protein
MSVSNRPLMVNTLAPHLFAGNGVLQRQPDRRQEARQGPGTRDTRRGYWRTPLRGEYGPILRLWVSDGPRLGLNRRLWIGDGLGTNPWTRSRHELTLC